MHAFYFLFISIPLLDDDFLGMKRTSAQILYTGTASLRQQSNRTDGNF